MKRAATAAPAQPEAADFQEIAARTAPGAAFISDALLEPLLVEARHRRATDLDTRFPIVSALILVLLLCAAWLA